MEGIIKKFLALCLLFCVTFSLFAREASGGIGLENTHIGAGAEVNANTREGAAIGGALSFGIDFGKQFAAGLRVIFSHDTESIFTVEPLAFFRYYLPLKIQGFFVQAEMGTSVFLEDDKSYPAFSIGAAAGWRYKFTDMFYIEPYARAGYPFIWGAGLTAGLLLPSPARKGGEQ